MRDFDTSGRSSDAAQVFTPCPIHCQGYRRPFFPTGLATDTAPGLATDAQARRNISHYQFIVNTTGRLLSQLSERIWGPPVCAGTTGGGGAPKRRRAHPTIVGENPRPPTSPSPQRRESTATHNRHSREGGNPRRGGAGGDGSPSPRGRRWASTIVIPAKAGIHGGGPGGMGPRLHGDDDGHTHNRRAGIHGHPYRHSREGGNPWRGAAGGWVPVSTGTTVGIHIVIPATAGGRRWVPACAGTTGRTHIAIPTTAGIHGHPYRHSREGGNPWRGAGADGSPSPRERRTHPGGGGNPRPPISSFPRRRESMAGRGRGGWVPVSTGTTDAPGRRRESTATHIVIPATAGIHGGGAGMGPRLHGDDDGIHIVIPATAGGRRWVPVSTGTTGAPTFPRRRRRRTHNRLRESTAPISSFPRRRESTATTSPFPRRRESMAGRGRGMGPRLHGDDDGHPHRHSRDSGGPGDGFPSPRERRRGGSQVISE